MDRKANLVLLSVDDIDQINEISYSYWYEQGIYSLETYTKILNSYLSYGYKINDELIALCLMKESKTKGIIVYLFAVKKTHLRQGYGRNLLTFSLDNAMANGHRKYELHVAADNEAALNLYLSVGFEITEYVYDYYSPTPRKDERNAYRMTIMKTNKVHVN